MTDTNNIKLTLGTGSGAAYNRWIQEGVKQGFLLIQVGRAPAVLSKKGKAKFNVGDKVRSTSARTEYSLGRGWDGHVESVTEGQRGYSYLIAWDDGSKPSSAPESCLEKIR